MAVEENFLRSAPTTAYASAHADELGDDLKTLIHEDLLGSQKVLENTLPLLLEQLKQTDVRAHGRFVKKLRHMISGDAYTATSADSSRIEELAVMKDNPLWPEIAKRIETRSNSC